MGWLGSNPLVPKGGGTGVANASTITIGGNVTFSGAHTFTGTLSNNTSVTFPTSGTLVALDANSNLSANSFLPGYATTATAAATTTLVVGSAEQQYFTGSTTQTVKMPVTSTLVLGQQFIITNNSSGVVTVQSSGANTIQAMAASTQLVLTVINTGVTTAAGWSISYTGAAGGGGITTITGDVGSISASTSHLYANTGAANCGSSVLFSETVSGEMDLIVTDSLLNTIIGQSAGNSSITGSDNTCFGWNSGNSLTSGSENTFFGWAAGSGVSDGIGNVCIGKCDIGFHGNSNVIVGNTSGPFGNSNTVIGDTTAGLTVGSNFSTIIGKGSATAFVGSDCINNIYIQAAGVNAETNVIRIGDSTSVIQAATTCYIGGISGATFSAMSPTPALVYIDTTNGQLYAGAAPASSHTATSTFGSITAGTPKQNTLGYDVLMHVTVKLTAATSAVLNVGVGSTSTPTVDPFEPSTAIAGSYSVSVIVPNNYYISITVTGTATVGSVTTVCSPL